MRYRLRLFTLMLGVVACIPIWADDPHDSPKWLTGKELDNSLRLAISGELAGNPFRQVLNDFAKRRSTSVFIDRRVDPTTTVSLSLIDRTAEQYLWKIAEVNGQGICRVGDTFYVGPLPTVERLPALLWERKGLSKQREGKDKRWRASQVLAWPALTNPRALIVDLCAQNQLTIVNPEAIPHDVWPAGQLSKLSLEHRLAILLAGFELWFEESSSDSIRLIPFPSIQQGTQVVRVERDAAKIARTLRRQHPECKFVGNRKSLKISGPVDTVSKVVRELVDEQDAVTGDPQESRFSLDTTATRRAILATIAKQNGWELNYPPKAQTLLQQQVTIKVSEQPISTIIKKVLRGTQLGFQIQGGVLRISGD